MASPALPDCEFSLIGDILSVRPFPCCVPSSLERLQLSPPVGSPSPANMLDVAPATIHCTRFVFTVDDCSDSFVITTWQIVHGSIPLNPLTIRGIMSARNSDDKPYQNLPNVHSILSFYGDLLTVNDNFAFVAVRKHSYFSADDDSDDDQFRDIF